MMERLEKYYQLWNSESSQASVVGKEPRLSSILSFVSIGLGASRWVPSSPTLLSSPLHRDPLQRRAPGLHSLACPPSWNGCLIFSVCNLSLILRLPLKWKNLIDFPAPKHTLGTPVRTPFSLVLSVTHPAAALCQTSCQSRQCNAQRRRSLPLGSLLVWHTQITFSNQGRVRTTSVLKWPMMLLRHLLLAHICPTETVNGNLFLLLSCVTFSKLIDHSELQLRPS